MTIPSFREVEQQMATLLRTQGALGVIQLDLTALTPIERGFGASAYQHLRDQVAPLLTELLAQGGPGDVLARDEREGDAYLLFVDLGRATQGQQLAVAGLRARAEAAEEALTPRVARLVLPYSREQLVLPVGYGVVLHSPLESEERQLLRLIDEAREAGSLRRRLRERDERESLIEVIFNARSSVWTVFQPIVEMRSRQVMSHEALSRGPRGSELESPGPLFSLAARHGLTEELERACRRKAFEDWEAFGAPGRLFVNTVPATVRDTSFLGRGVLDYLGANTSPRFVTLEITERQVIENLALYREAMHPFLDLGFTFAIDDLGAGYSGLETVASLAVSYLKIDIALVRDLHQKRINQQVVKAILEMGAGVGATVIAEGIQSDEETQALLDLGVRYGQGYYFARPVDPYAPRPRVEVRKR